MSRIKNDAPEQKIVKTAVEPLKPKVKAAAVTKVPSKVFSDGMSNGKGAALRLKSANLLGGMPTVASAPNTKSEGIRAMSVAAPRELDWVQVANANRDYEKNRNTGAGLTGSMIGLMEQHKNEPDYLAQLIKRAKDPKDGVLEYITGPLNGAFMKGPDGKYVNGFTEEDRALISSSVQAARDAGTISDQELRELAARSSGAADLAQRVGVEGAGGTSGSSTATAALEQVKGNYDSAHKDAEERTQRLQKELANFGPDLTDAQRADFIKAFKAEPKNAEVYANETKAATALAEHLETNKAAILDAATRDPAAAKKLYASLQVLNESGHGKTALSFAVDIQKDPSSPLGQAFAKFDKFDDEITAPAMTAATTQLIAENPDDVTGALDQLKEMVEPLKSAWEGKKGFGDIKDAWAAIDDASHGRYDGLKKLAGEFKESPVLKGFAGIGVIAGAATAVGEVQQGEYLDALKDFTKQGSEGLKLLAGATSSLAEAGKLAQYGEQGLKFAKFAERLAPGLGLISSATSLALNIQKAGKEGPNVGYAVAALGDALGVLGSAVELIPGGQVPGALFNGIGAIVSAGGEILGGFIEGQQFKNEQSKYLDAAHVTEPLKSILMKADREQSEALRKTGMTAEQIQTLALQYPQLVETSHGYGPNIENLIDVQKRTGLSGTQVFQMLQAADENSANGEGMAQLLHHFTRAIDFPEINQAGSVAQLITALEVRARETSSPEQAAALRQAATYLDTQQSHYGQPY